MAEKPQWKQTEILEKPLPAILQEIADEAAKKASAEAVDKLRAEFLAGLAESERGQDEKLAKVAKVLAELARAMAELRAELKTAIINIATALRAEFKAVEGRLDAKIAALKAELLSELKGLVDVVKADAAKLETLDDVVVAVVTGLMTKADGSSKSWQSLIDQLKAKGFKFEE